MNEVLKGSICHVHIIVFGICERQNFFLFVPQLLNCLSMRCIKVLSLCGLYKMTSMSTKDICRIPAYSIYNMPN